VHNSPGESAEGAMPSPMRRRTWSVIRSRTNDPTFDADLDWEATLAYRRHLWSLGLSVAEAMDTAQRGMGLGWKTSRELIRHSLAEAREAGGGIACGAGTDHLDPAKEVTLREIKRAYEEQCAFVEGEGGG
jgi:hypothetical protein